MTASKSFSGQSPAVPHLAVSNELGDLRGDVEAGFQASEALVENGSFARANLKMATKPTATDTVTIGSNVYEFGGTGSNINVAIGAAVANSRTNLAAAINASGTAAVFAEVSTVPTAGVSIVAADAKGGTPVKGPGASIALSEGLTAVADVWDQANLSATGVAEGTTKKATGKVAINAVNVASIFAIKLDFTASKITWAAFSAAGAPKVTSATVTISGNYLLVNAAAGATALVDTDFIVFTAIE
jgi:hypothetical protein